MIITVGLVVGVVTGAFAQSGPGRALRHRAVEQQRSVGAAVGLTRCAYAVRRAADADRDVRAPSATSRRRPNCRRRSWPAPTGPTAGPGQGHGHGSPAVRVKDARGRLLRRRWSRSSSGAALFRQQAGRPLIPASTMKLLTSAAALSLLGPEHTFTTSVVSPKRGQIDPGRRRRPLPGQASPRADTFPRAGLGGRPGQEHRDGPAQGQDHDGPAGLRRRPVRRSGLEPDLAERLRRPGDPGLGAVGGRGPARRPDPPVRERATRPGRPPTAFAAALRKQGDPGHRGRPSQAPRDGRPGGQRLLDAAGADRRAGADGQRQRRAPRCCSGRWRWRQARPGSLGRGQPGGPGRADQARGCGATAR